MDLTHDKNVLMITKWQSRTEAQVDVNTDGYLIWLIYSVLLLFKKKKKDLEDFYAQHQEVPSPADDGTHHHRWRQMT